MKWRKKSRKICKPLFFQSKGFETGSISTQLCVGHSGAAISSSELGRFSSSGQQQGGLRCSPEGTVTFQDTPYVLLVVRAAFFWEPAGARLLETTMVHVQRNSGPASIRGTTEALQERFDTGSFLLWFPEVSCAPVAFTSNVLFLSHCLLKRTRWCLC